MLLIHDSIIYIPYESILTKKQHSNRENIYYIQMREIHLKKENNIR